MMSLHKLRRIESGPLAKRISMVQQTYSESALRGMSHDELIRLVLGLHNEQNQNAENGGSCDSLRRKKADGSDESTASLQSKKQKRREFDMKKYGQRMIALRLAYLGWCHHGLASQPDSDNAVEDHLFAALKRTRLIESRDTAKYSRSGRTDVGVSASDQIIGVRVRSNVVPPSSGDTEIDYIKTLNSALPKSIRALAWSPAPDGTEECIQDGVEAERRRPMTPFSARFDAVYRSYKYYFVKGRMNINAMREGAAYMVGRHDFRNFCKVDTVNVKSFERLLHQVDIVRDGTEGIGEYEQYYIFVRGQAFLWHQIRCMAAILFEVGCEREAPDVTKRMLDDVKSGTGPFANGKPHYRMASPTPLVLCECVYPKGMLSFKYSLQTRDSPRTNGFLRADQDLAMAFADASAKTSIVRSMLIGNDEVNISDQDGTHPRYGQVRDPRILVENASATYKNTTLDRRKCGKSVEEARGLLNT